MSAPPTAPALPPLQQLKLADVPIERTVLRIARSANGLSFSGDGPSLVTGAAAPDLTVLRGGVFLYPPTDKNREGKLRLRYEANPMAFLAEQAGGMGHDGTGRLMEKQPTALHQRTPLIIGSKTELERVLSFTSPS